MKGVTFHAGGQRAHMVGHFGSIVKETLKNRYFRKALFTGRLAQLVAMSLRAGEEISNEVHQKVSRFFRIEQGELKFVLENGRGVTSRRTGTQ